MINRRIVIRLWRKSLSQSIWWSS